MVEYKNGVYDGRSDDSPPMVQAEPAIMDYYEIEPMRVSVVTIDGDGDPLCQGSVISWDSAEADATPRLDNDAAHTNADVDSSSLTWSAGIAGGVVGTLVGGPVLGIVAGGAAAYYSEKSGAAGDISRALGDVGKTTAQKAKELNEKHKLVDKSKEAAGSAWQKVKELNEAHHVADRSKKAAAEAWENFKEFDQRHGVVNKMKDLAFFCVKKFVKFIEYVVARMQEIEPCESSTPTCHSTMAQATVH